MKRLLVLILPALMLLASPAAAQNTVSARVVTTCGTPGNTPVVGNAYPLTQDTTLTLCTAGGGGGGGGGAVTIANGADTAQGSIGDAAWSGTGNGTSIAILKSIRGLLASPLAVTGTFWQATQPVSGTITANLGTLNGVSTAALQGAQGTGATYNPPTGGSGEIGYLSGIYAAAIDPAAVATKPAPGTTTDASSTVTTGGTFQTVLAASGTRLGCFLQNPLAATEPMFVYEGTGTATTAKSINLAPGAAFNCNSGGVVATGLVQVTAATTGHAFVAKSQ